MALRFTLQVEGEAQIDRALTRFADHVSDLRPAWPAVVQVIRSHATKQFATEGSYGPGGGWKALSPKYAKRKAKKWPGRPILEASGQMKRSLVGHTTDSILNYQPLSFGYGTKRGYASYHQKGTPRMPQRKIIDLTETDKRDVTRAIQRELVRQARSDNWTVENRES